jgi:hypothetical protein
VSYKNDAPGKRTDSQWRIRARILERVSAPDTPFGIRLRTSPALSRAMLADGRGDFLDAMLCALQAARAWLERDHGYGLPASVDPVEGWIVSVPGPEREDASRLTRGRPRGLSGNIIELPNA